MRTCKTISAAQYLTLDVMPEGSCWPSREIQKNYGVAPSTSASDRVIIKGITTLGETLIDLESKFVFDVVVSIDVIEHVLDVETFLADAHGTCRQEWFIDNIDW